MKIRKIGIPPGGSTGQALVKASASDFDTEWGAGGGGGGGTPGGIDTQVQFNDGGAFGGDAGMTYNKTTNTLTIEEIENDAVELALTQSMYLMTR